MSRIKTPELDKMKDVHEKSQRIGEFLEWLRDEKHYVLAIWTKGPCENDEDVPCERLQPVIYHIEELLANYFKIDSKAAELERQAILEDFRKRNKIT